MASPLNSAVEFLMAGRLAEARRACRKALQARADLAEAHMLLAEIHRLEGDDAGAKQSLERTLRLRAGWTEAHVEVALGDLYGDFQRFEEAERHYRRALPSSDARYNLAGLLRAQGRTDESIVELQALIAHDPKARDAREHLVRLLQDARRFDEVDALCHAGVDLHPGDAFFPQKLGVALWWRDRHEDALAAYRRAANLGGELHDESKFLEASALLTLGRYREGWSAYHFRPTRPPLLQRHPEIARDPSPIEGAPKSIRVYQEQGLGDEVFFMRFARELRGRGHRLSLVCEPKLAAIASPLGLFDAINAGGAADLALCSGDLALASGVDFALPLALELDERKAAALRERLAVFGPPPYVGATWRAGTAPAEQTTRAWFKEIAPEALAQALRPLKASVVVLQRKPRAAELRSFAGALGRDALDLSEVNDDLPSALAILSLLDEYVGVSNTNMHLLAGLPGKRARVLVLTPPEWRWGLAGKASAWFPDFTLYRQRLGKNWDAALAELREDLRRLYAA